MSLTSDNGHFDDILQAEWQRALTGDAQARAQWNVVDGDWGWDDAGVRVRATGPEWLAFSWRDWNADLARTLKNFLIEVKLSGKADAAGISFGAYKDFLTEIDPKDGTRHLQLEVDVDAGRWALRVDGRLKPRCWWDAAVTGVEDILNGELRLKVRGAQSVLFQDLATQRLDAPCRLTIVVTCYRFLQRLRLSLRNWCHQDVPAGTYEILVVNPQSPDGTHEHLAAVTRSYPHIRLREISVDSNLAMNKGAMINRAVAMSRGEWIWLTDADCLFGPESVATVLDQISDRPRHLFFGERRFLTASQTDALLSGRSDPVSEFDELANTAVARSAERYHWGYTQIVHRSTLERVPYDENNNHFAHSDGSFADACRRNGVSPQLVPGLFCLHLDHPFSWFGSDMFL